MQESFLHYLWQMQYFDKKELRSAQGDAIEIYKPGILNSNAGPDFANARLKIGSIDWIGSVEVHTRSSEWFNHHHDTDPSYDNVILHLVWQNDNEIVRNDGTILPTLELRGRVDEKLIKTYRQLTGSAFDIPCQKSLPDVSEITKLSMLEKSFVQRLQRKAADVNASHQLNKGDWDETFYQRLFLNFGFKVNADPFSQLSRALPLKIIRKHTDRPDQIEAMLFGQAGFLDAARGDAYFMTLKREYNLLARKYDLQTSKMSKSQWRFLRMRPANFPTLRLAQLAALFHQRQNIFSSILEAENLKDIEQLFSVHPSPYWVNHYRFMKESKRDLHQMGQSSISNVIINTILPVWVAYGMLNDDDRFMERALRIVQLLPPEQNKITRSWNDAGIDNHNSFDSQAMIELYNFFCQKRNCLDCAIGSSLIRPQQ